MFKIIVAIGMFLLSSAVRADDVRKIDFTAVLTDQDGDPMRECSDKPLPADLQNCKTYRLITLGLVALGALVTQEPGQTPETVVLRGELGLRLYKATAVVLTPEEIVLLKTLIAKRYNTLIGYRAFRLIDPTVR